VAAAALRLMRSESLWERLPVAGGWVFRFWPLLDGS
jgi:hypothetical protein